jgi:Exonuclease
MRPLVAVDLETTGLDPFYHDIIEVGVVSLAGELTFSLPFDLGKADHEALEVNGWGKRPFPEQQSTAWAVGMLADVLDDAHIIGKNPQFDAAFLEALFRRRGMKPTWHHRLVDIGAMAWGWHSAWASATIGGPPTLVHQPPDVEQVSEMLVIPREVTPDGYHTALDDARWAFRALQTMLPDYQKVVSP